MVAATSDGDAEQVSGAAGTRRARPGGLVGRDHELNEGLAAIEDAAAGEGGLLLISGEPGIGKSRLADELGRRARERGFQVAWGRCWEAGGAPAYWPWVQSLRAAIRWVDAADLRAELGDAAVAIGQLLPELALARPEVSKQLAQDHEAARFRLFDSVTTLLRRVAVRRPVLIVLDDLQMADTPSLLLLRFVAALIDSDPILIIATYRDIDPALVGALAETVTELMRGRAVSRLVLTGIAEGDVPRFVEAVTGVLPRDQLVRLVYQETEGNPLFLEEVSRVLLEEGTLTASVGVEKARVPVPRSVRDVISRRLRPFSDESVRVLRVASVLGREFDLDVLSGVAGKPTRAVLELMQAPLEEQLLTEVPESRGRLRFRHVIIRECLYDEIPRAQRQQLHRTALRVLESLNRDDIDQQVSQLAHHAYDGAGDQAQWAEAITYSRRAGDRALALLAYEEAVRLQRQALDSLEQSRVGDLLLRCELVLALGDAQARAGDEAGSKATFLQGAELARGLGRIDHLAHAALGYAGRHAWGRAGADTQLVPLLEAAVAAVGDVDSALRSRLLARLAGALRDAPGRQPRESYAEEAVAIARRIEDPVTLGYALDGLFGATYRPDNAEERRDIGAEIVRLGKAAGDREMEIWGHLDRLVTHFELGELQLVRDEIAVVRGVAGELRQPEMRWLAGGTAAALALTEGRLRDAESLTAATFDAGQRSRSSDAVSAYTGQMFQLRREQGRLSEVEHLVQRAARDLTWYPVFRCMLAALHLDLGRDSQARVEFKALSAAGFDNVPFDNYWVFNMSLLAELAHALGDETAAAALYERLRPYAMSAAYAPPEACLGSVSRPLGLLAETLGRYDAAVRHFDDGLAHNGRMGARPWVAHTQHEYALLLLEHCDPSEHERARMMLSEALSTCEQIGMPVLASKVKALLADVPGHRVVASEPAPVAERGTIALEGEYWTVTYAGHTARLRNSKGMHILARLMSTPGRPHPSLDLERIGETGDDSTARAVAASDAGEMLDDEARRAYRARIAQLRTAIDEAQTAGAADRAGALREELDFITRELSRGLGIGGRARRSGSAAERARINVTRAVKAAMLRLRDADPDLAAHFSATLHTGTVCVYTPDPRSPIEWTVTTRRT